MTASPCNGCGGPRPSNDAASCWCGWCKVCGARRAVARGRCRTDYEYLRRHGVDTPYGLLYRRATRPRFPSMEGRRWVRR